MEIAYRKVVSLARYQKMVNLGKFLTKIGVKEKDRVCVIQWGNVIVISTNELKTLNFYGIDEELFNKLLSYIVRKHGTDNLLENLRKEIEECIRFRLEAPPIARFLASDVKLKS